MVTNGSFKPYHFRGWSVDQTGFIAGGHSNFLIKDGVPNPARLVEPLAASDDTGSAMIEKLAEIISRNTSLTPQVNPFNLKIAHRIDLLPTISTISDQTVFGRTILGFGAPVLGPLAFVVDDLQSLPEHLTVIATSDNQSMIEDQDLLISGTGRTRFISVADIGHVGTRANITLTVTNGRRATASSTFTITSFSGNSVLVDNRSAGFSSTGIWQESPSIDEFSGSSFVSESHSDATATFTPVISVPGDYEVLVWWSKALSNGNSAIRSSNVQYTINHNQTSQAVILDQRARSGEWVSLGTYTFLGDDGENVTLGGFSDRSLNIMSADAIAFVATGSASFLDDVIVDELDVGFRRSDGWAESGVENEFRDRSLYTYSPTASASWTPQLRRAGFYEVFLWLSRETDRGTIVDRASSVVYEVKHGSLITRFVVDQNVTETGTWTVLGTLEFDGMGDESVTLLPGSAHFATGSVGADAIRFSPQDQLTTIDSIVDNLDENFNTTGSWVESAALDEYNSSSVYSTNAEDRARWEFPKIIPGTYEVFVWYSAALPGGRAIRRNEQTRYFVESRGKKALVVIDQNEFSGEWVSLGEFEFDGNGNEGILLQSSGRSTSADAARFIRSN